MSERSERERSEKVHNRRAPIARKIFGLEGRRSLRLTPLSPVDLSFLVRSRTLNTLSILNLLQARRSLEQSGGHRIRESAVDKRPPQCQAPSSDVGEANAQLHNFGCPSLLPLLISNCCLLQCSAMFVRLTAGVSVFFRSKRRILTEILQYRAPLCPFPFFGR